MAGIEPATVWLKAIRSTELSYISKWNRWELNPRLMTHKIIALPLSYDSCRTLVP